MLYPGGPSPLFDRPAPRRKRVLMRLAMLVLLVLAVFAGFKILPLAPGKLSTRDAGRLLDRGKAWETQGTYRSAAETYARVAAAENVERALRLNAAERLLKLYAGPLEDPEGAAETLALIGKIAGGGSKPKAAATPAVRGSVIARVGDERITTEQVLFAWRQMNGPRPPQGDEFEQFVNRYLDMVLMADEARRRGLEQRGQIPYELALSRLVTLNRALTTELINELEAPTEEKLVAFAQETWGSDGPTSATIGMIEVEGADAAREVERRLREGEEFAAVARDASEAAGALEQGYIAGSVTSGSAPLAALEARPELADKLLMYAEGVTTGPIRLDGRSRYFKVLRRDPGRITSVAGWEEQALKAYQMSELARRQQGLLNGLREERGRIELFDGAMPGASPVPSPPAPAARRGGGAPAAEEGR